jgi:GT2 family glycosyltransferase
VLTPRGTPDQGAPSASAIDRGPTVGIVVPVGPGVTDELGAQLAAFVRQTWPGAISLLVSCNGASVSRVERLVNTIAWPTRWTTTVIDSSAVPGPAAARNAGWRRLDTDLVLFCDADDVVSDTWVAGMVRGLEGAGVCTGPLLHDALNEPSMWRSVQQPWPVLRFAHLPHTTSANLGMRRHVLEQTDGFDPAFRAAEDIDLAWRATYLGYPTRFEPTAVVQYRLRRTTAALFRNHRHYARWDHALVEKHRAYGASWQRREIVRHVLAACWAVPCAPLGRRRRRVAAVRLGTLVGWLGGAVSRGSTSN